MIPLLTVDIIKNGRDYYSISFPFNNDLISKIKTLEKKEWLSNEKVWKLDAYNLYKLINLHKGSTDIFFNFKDVKDKEQFIVKYRKELKKKELEKLELEKLYHHKGEYIKLKHDLQQIDDIEKILDYKKYLKEGIIPYKHQLIGAVLSKFANRQLLGVDVGGGKTLLALLTAETYEDKLKKVLVIVPNSLKFNWAMEVEKFTNQKAFVLNEKKSNNKYTLEESKFVICNYDYFRTAKFDFCNKIEKYGLSNPDMMIFDESHKLKNTKSNTTKNIVKYFKKIGDIPLLMLSGTPMPNRLEELFVQLNFVAPKEFPSKNKFYTEYCNLKYDFQKGWVETDKPLDLDKLVEKLNTLMYRVKKKDVLKNLPEIQINKIYLELTPEQEKQYQLIESGMAKISWENNQSFLFQKNNDETFSQSNDNFLTLATKLRQFNSIAKFDIIKEYIENFNEIGDKVVVFDQYVKTLSELTQHFNTNSKLYYGGIDSFTKQSYVNEFQDKNSLLKNLFITTGSGNFGITLTAASKLFMLNQSFIPSENEQCWARIHRIGQEHPVSIFIFIFKNTIDEYIDDLLKDKLKVISKVIDNEDYVDKSNIETSIIKDLFNRFKNKYN